MEDKEENKAGIGWVKGVREFYRKEYKKLMYIPFLILFLAIISIGYQFYTTGDFINRDVSLKGGLTLTVPMDTEVDISAIESSLRNNFPARQFNVRALTSFGEQKGFIVTSDMDGTDQELIDSMIGSLSDTLGTEINEGGYTVEFIGSSLGESFFNETIKAIVIAFIFMGAVVFLYFANRLMPKLVVCGITLVITVILYSFNHFIANIIVLLLIIVLLYVYFRYNMPSLAVVLAAFSDIVVTLAVVNLIGMKIGTAGIAAFLMLIGYSVDTDILLTTRVLKRREGTVFERTLNAFRTGIVMALTTIAAVSMALMFTDSVVIRQIMLILLIGLFADIINTWLQNAGLLRFYLERK